MRGPSRPRLALGAEGKVWKTLFSWSREDVTQDFRAGKTLLRAQMLASPLILLMVILIFWHLSRELTIIALSKLSGTEKIVLVATEQRPSWYLLTGQVYVLHWS